MSQSGYEKLKHTPAEGRSLADEVRLIMHEGMMQLREENEASQKAEQVLPLYPVFIYTGARQVFNVLSRQKGRRSTPWAFLIAAILAS